ncbi:MAG: histidine phosphatase family protein [Lachnospiraceae bacterium]
MILYLIRHGETQGNREHRYVGRTDESLLPEACAKLKTCQMPPIERLYVSPMIRCLQTATLLYPQIRQQIVPDFRECDFGMFEYHTYPELRDQPAYQHFIDTAGRSGFPKGEDRDTFQHRCVNAFEHLRQTEKLSKGNIAFVIHGGTIMALLDHYSHPHLDYYEWQIANGGYLTVEVIGDRWIART